MIMWYECTQIKLLVFSNIINGITNIYLVTFTTVHGISNIVIIRLRDMADLLNECDWDLVCQSRDVNEAWEKFSTMFTQVLDDIAPEN